jgi:alpha-tubulin suppressor-like RCC1 family protein
MRYSRDSFYRASALVALVITFGCGGSDSVAPTVPPALTVQAGANQSVVVATATPVSPSVTLTDSHGGHPAGITVTFTPDSGAGSVSTPSAKTDNSGVASAGVWTIGTVATTQHLTASATVDGTVVNTTLSVTALPGRAAVIKIVSGDAQNGPYGATLVTPIQVSVRDQYGNATPGENVRFSVDTGGVTAAADTTGTDGTASTRVRLPVTTGPVVLSIAADSVPGVTSTFTSRGIRFASFTMDANTTCGLSVEGYPYCWGDNAAEQLVPVGVPEGRNAIKPWPVKADLDLKSISVADIGGCALRTDGTAVCWGSNVFGANGNGSESLQLEPMTAVAGGLSFVEVQRGPNATCGTTRTGQSYCWGGNGVGQIGSANLYQTSVLKPALVDSNITFHSYALGSLHTCALDPSGKAYCWGMDLQGRLGVAAASVACNSTTYTSSGSTTIATTCSPSPVPVNTSLRFTTLAGASDATCGLDSGGTAYCWGSNDFEQLGNGSSVADTVPAQVPGAPAFKQLSAHDRGFCGLTSAGDIYCWGYVGSVVGVPNLSCPNYSDCTPTPTKVQTGRQFSSISFTTGQLCGISDGTAYCWGGDYHGALGIGVGNDLGVTTPTQVSGQTP